MYTPSLNCEAITLTEEKVINASSKWSTLRSLQFVPERTALEVLGIVPQVFSVTVFADINSLCPPAFFSVKSTQTSYSIILCYPKSFIYDLLPYFKNCRSISLSSIRRAQNKHAKNTPPSTLAMRELTQREQENMKEMPEYPKFVYRQAMQELAENAPAKATSQKGPGAGNNHLQHLSSSLPFSSFPQICLSCITCSLHLLYNTYNSSVSYHYKLLLLTFSNVHLSCRVSSATAFS